MLRLISVRCTPVKCHNLFRPDGTSASQNTRPLP